MGASEGPNSWENEILLLLVWRERKQGLIWERADVGWSLELFVSLDVGPCRAALRSEVMLGLL